MAIKRTETSSNKVEKSNRSTNLSIPSRVVVAIVGADGGSGSSSKDSSCLLFVVFCFSLVLSFSCSSFVQCDV